MKNVSGGAEARRKGLRGARSGVWLLVLVASEAEQFVATENPSQV